MYHQSTMFHKGPNQPRLIHEGGPHHRDHLLVNDAFSSKRPIYPRSDH